MDRNMSDETLKEKFDRIVDEIDKLMAINPDHLDSESLRTVRIMSDLHKYLNREAILLRELMNLQEKVVLSRWKFYTGIASPEEYKNEPLKQKPLKTEVDRWMKADSKIQIINAQVQMQDRIVKFIEEAIYSAKRRGLDIKNAIDYRKMMMG